MEIKKISSRKNEIIKETAALLKSSNRKTMFLVEGARLCYDAVRSQTSVFRLFYTQKAFSKYSEYIVEIQKIAKEVYIVEEHVAQALSDTKNTQAVFAVCEKKGITNEIKGKILVMENIQDPANMGTILRTGEAVGIDTFVLLGDCCDAYSPKVTRSSMGAVFRLNLVKFEKLEDLMSKLKENGYKSYAAVPNDTAKDITSVKFDDKSAVFIGNEGNGLTQECINSCQSVTIPMLGRAESLNASVAASIIMWEMVRNV